MIDFTSERTINYKTNIVTSCDRTKCSIECQHAKVACDFVYFCDLFKSNIHYNERDLECIDCEKNK